MLRVLSAIAMPMVDGRNALHTTTSFLGRFSRLLCRLGWRCSMLLFWLVVRGSDAGLHTPVTFDVVQKITPGRKSSSSQHTKENQLEYHNADIVVITHHCIVPTTY